MDLLGTLQLLVTILFLGTGYAWYQFIQVLRKKCDTCSLDLGTNPFRSKCFVGAIFFTLALILSIYSLMLL